MTTKSSMAWTDQQPTEAGYYWFRSASGNAEVIEVRKWGERLEVWDFGFDYSIKMTAHPVGLWFGPLAPPDTATSVRWHVEISQPITGFSPARWVHVMDRPPDDAEIAAFLAMLGFGEKADVVVREIGASQEGKP